MIGALILARVGNSVSRSPLLHHLVLLQIQYLCRQFELHFVLAHRFRHLGRIVGTRGGLPRRVICLLQ